MKRSSYLSTILPALLILITTGTAALAVDAFDSFDDFERKAEHDARLNGLDLTNRHPSQSGSRLGAAQSADYPDFRISQSISPARFDQTNAEIIQLADKGWLAVWDDNRFGSRKIFRQRFDSLLNTVGVNELVAGSSTGADYVDPLLARDTLNRIYLFYRDRTNGFILGSRYTSTLQVDLPPFLVNDTSFNSFAGPYDFAVFPGGECVVTWENYSTLGSTIEMRLYGPSGSSQVGPAKVNSETGSVQHWVPSVAVAPGSGFLIAWEDYRNNRADIRCRLFTGGGAAVGADFAIVPPPSDSANQYAPTVTYSSKDRYVIGWVDTRSGQEIYLQRYHQTTGLVGNNQRISGGDTLVLNWDLHLTTSTAGRNLATWADFGATNRILGLRLDSGLVAVGSPAQLNTATTGRRWNPCGKYDSGGRVMLSWTGFTDEDANIRLRQFDSALLATALPEVRANDDQLGAPSVDPFILASAAFRHVILWTDQRRDAGDIYLRNISVAGIPYSGEFKLNQDPGYNLQSEPYAAASSSSVLAVWIDSRNISGSTGQRIFGRFCELNGTPVSGEFLISDTSANAVKSTPVVAMTPDGQALVAWIDLRDGTSQVWGRWLTTGGAVDGDEFQISNEVGGITALYLHAAIDNAGRFGLAWLDVGGTDPEVKGVWYASDKNLDDTYGWVPTIPGVSVAEFAADFHVDGSLAAFVAGSSPGKTEGYAAKISSAGVVLNTPFKVTDDTLAAVSSPAVSVSENDDVSLVWLDRRSGSAQVFAQLLDPGYSTVGNNAPVSVVSPEFMQQPHTAAYRGRAWYVWSDPRTEGLNIWCAGVIYDATSTDDDPVTLPNEYHLSQNYPNPFNPSTVISFTLPTAAEVRLDVINLLGQRVTTLVDVALSAGEHFVTWSGEDQSGNRVASGVYFYRLETDDFSQTRKMLLLK